MFVSVSNLMTSISLVIAFLFPTMPWQMPPLPDREGLAGMFAGVSHGALIVAGGANFPDKKPWDGGRKVWTDLVWVLESPNGPWIQAGKLEQSLGYGVSVSDGEGVICLGGSNELLHTRTAFRLRWQNRRLHRDLLPSLPFTLANACGVVIGKHVYLAGGIRQPESKTALKSAFRLDLSKPHSDWESLDPLPGRGRMLAMATGASDSFWVIGGVDFDRSGQRVYLKDGFRLSPGKGWISVSELPYALAAAPSPLPSLSGHFRILGGDDGRQLHTPPDHHLEFNRTILRHDISTGHWHKYGQMPVGRVTAPCVQWHGRWIVVSGECKPGIRSPQIWSYP